MPRAARLLLPLLLFVPLSGCLNDPFGMKPEVRGVKIPEKPAPAETVEPEAEPEAPKP